MPTGPNGGRSLSLGNAVHSRERNIMACLPLLDPTLHDCQEFENLDRMQTHPQYVEGGHSDGLRRSGATHLSTNLRWGENPATITAEIGPVK